MNDFDKKWIRWVSGSLGIVVTLLVIIAIALPRLVQWPGVHEKIESYLAQQCQGHLTYENMALTYFPRPQFQIQGISLAIPDQLTGTIGTAHVTPSLLSLMMGKIKIVRIALVKPDWRINYTQDKKGPPIRFEDVSAYFAGKKILPIPIKKIAFQKARLIMEQNARCVFSFENMNGTYQQTPLSARFKGAAKSNLWEKADMDIQADFSQQNANATFHLKGFRPHLLTTHFWPHASFQALDTKTEATGHITVDGTGNLELSLKTNSPRVTLQRGDETLLLKGKTVSTSVLVSKNKTRISITDAKLTSPSLSLTAHFFHDKKRSHLEWAVDAKKIDIPSLRQASNFTVGNYQIARVLADVIRGGYVSEFSIQNHANTPSELKDLQNLKLHGHLDKGYIFVPEVALHLKHVKADVSAAKGVLKATPITAQLGNSVGKNGFFSLSIGLENPRPFHVDCDVVADLKDLPSTLKQLVPNNIFKQEMANITSAEGKALGKLVIKRTGAPIDVEVDVSSFDLKGAYTRIPFPIRLEGGTFIYRKNGIRLQDIGGKIGASTLAELNAALDWEKALTLTIPSGTATLDTDELFPWLMSYGKVQGGSKYIQAMEGSTTIKKMTFKGPLFSPKNWQYSFSAKVDNLQVQLPLFPKPILCHGGGLIIEPNICYFDNAHITALEASARMVGAFSGYMEGNKALDAYFYDGKLSKDMSIWLQHNAGMVNDCKWHPPLSVSSMHLVWQEEKGFEVGMQASSGGDLFISLDLSKNDDELYLKQLSIRDAQSNADICFFQGKEEINITFDGKLAAITLDRLLLKNRLLSGTLQGDCNMQFFQASPEQSTVYGKLHLDGLQFYKFGWPFQIEQLSLEGQQHRMNISQARIIWEDSLLFIAGTVAQYQKGLKLDMQLIADRFDWQEINEAFQSLKKTRSNAEWPLDLYGTLKASAGTFEYSDTVTLGPFETSLYFNKDELTATLTKAQLCGIAIPGTIRISPDTINVSLRPVAENQNLTEPFSCFGNGNVFMDGRFSITSNLNAEAKKGAPIAPACVGDIIFTAKEGRIYKLSLLAKVFTLLNVAELVTGEFPSLDKEGFPYKNAQVKGTFKNGVLELKEGLIDGPAMKIFFHGKENYLEKTHNITIVVAPLKTLDMLLEKIPVVSDVLNKGAVIYPVKVTGSWDNPKLQPVSAGAVGMEVLGIIGRTLNLPVTLIKKFLPGDKTDDNK